VKILNRPAAVRAIAFLNFPMRKETYKKAGILSRTLPLVYYCLSILKVKTGKAFNMKLKSEDLPCVILSKAFGDKLKNLWQSVYCCTFIFLL
jgi:hypothetical protein